MSCSSLLQLGIKIKMIQRISISIAVIASLISGVLPAQAQAIQTEDLQISAQNTQQNSDGTYSDQQLNGLANQINETANPTVSSRTVRVHPVPNVQGLPDNLVLIESGLDTSSPQDTFGNYAIGVSF